MYDEILFPTDGSDEAASVFEHVLEIADAHDSTIHILNVADTTQVSVARIQGEVIDVLEQEGEEIIQEAAERAEERGITTDAEVIQGKPFRTIIEYADSHGVDIVVLPTHGRSGLERFLLGSTTERVIRRTEVPVLSIRPDADSAIEYPFKNVLVPTDGSDCANQALALGVDVAKAEGATLHLLSVIAIASLGVDVRSEIHTDTLEERASDLIDEARAFAENSGVDSVSGSIEFGPSVNKVISSYVEEHNVDLIVAGTHGRSGFDRYIMGSVTEDLIRTAPVPVLTVREPPQEA